MAVRKLDSNLSLRERAIELNGADRLCSWLGGKAPPTERLVKAKRVRNRVNPETIKKATEHELQCAVVRWWGMQCASYGLPAFALFSIPNANMLMGKADHPERVMAYLKAEGFRKGAPDLMLAVPNGGAHGMVIEMKRDERALVAPEQLAFQTYFARIGYKAIVARSSDAAIEAIRVYLIGYKQAALAI